MVVNAQRASVTVKVTFDLKKGSFPKSMPFDKPFIIDLIPLRKDRPEYAYFHEVQHPDPAVPNAIQVWDTNPTGTQLSISPSLISEDRFDLFSPPLAPSKYYDLILIYKIDSSAIDTLIIKVFNRLHAGGVLRTQQAQSSYDRLRNLNNGVSPNRTDIKIWNATWTDLQTFYSNQIVPIYQQPFTRSNYFNSYRPAAATVTSINGLKQAALAELQKQKAGTDGFLEYLNVLNNTSNARDHTLMGLKSVDSTMMQNLTSEYSFRKRIKNIEKSLKVVFGLLESAKIIDISVPNTYDIVATDLESLIKQLEDNKILLQNMLKSIAPEIHKYRLPPPASNILAFRSGLWIQSATVTSGFKESNKNIVVPDFGLVHMGADQRNDGWIYFPRLYAGLNISPRPIDKNIQFDHLVTENKFWYRMSFALGVAIGGPNTRDFEPLYSNMSLMVGMNYRIYPQGRIGLGMSLFKEKHPNPTIKESRIEPGVYILMSLDLEALNEIPKLVGKIFGS